MSEFSSSPNDAIDDPVSSLCYPAHSAERFLVGIPFSSGPCLTVGTDTTPIDGLLPLGASLGRPPRPPDSDEPHSLSASEQLVIDPELRDLLPPLSAAEFEGLERKLLREGCTLALVVWRHEGKVTLVDGHNRYRICSKHVLPFTVVERAFADWAAARDWVVSEHIDKRNLTPLGLSYARGLRYLREKAPQGGTGANQHQNKRRGRPAAGEQKTAQRLAAAYGVDEKTIRRDGELARLVNALVANCGEIAKQRLLTRDQSWTRPQIDRLSALPPEEQRRILVAGLPPKQALPSEPRGRASGQWVVPAEPVQLVEELGRRLGLVELAEVIQGLSALVARRSEGEITPTLPAAVAAKSSRGSDEDGPPLAPAAWSGTEGLTDSAAHQSEQSGHVVHSAE